MKRRAAFAAATVIAAVATTSPAGAADKQACVAAFEAGQTARKEGRLQDARERLLTCSSPSCPNLIVGYCRAWLDDVDKALPTIVIGARDAQGRDIAEVAVSVDGRRVLERLDGKAMPIDPGAHVLRFETPRGQRHDQNIIVREAEKSRRVDVAFEDGTAGAATSATPPDDAAAPAPGPPLLAFVSAGIGIVAIGSFAYFGLSALADEKDLRDTCAPECDSSAVDGIKTKNIVSAVSLGVGVVAIGVASYLFLAPRKGAAPRAAASTRFGVWPMAGGGGGGMTGTF